MSILSITQCNLYFDKTLLTTKYITIFSMYMTNLFFQLTYNMYKKHLRPIPKRFYYRLYTYKSSIFICLTVFDCMQIKCLTP